MGEVFPLRITRLYRRITGLSKLIPSRLKQIKNCESNFAAAIVATVIFVVIV